MSSGLMRYLEVY